MLFLGCDSGSTKIAFSVADDSGRVLVKTEFPAITLSGAADRPMLRICSAMCAVFFRAPELNPAS